MAEDDYLFVSWRKFIYMWLTEVNCGINKHLIYHITLQPLSPYLFNITSYKLEFLLDK